MMFFGFCFLFLSMFWLAFCEEIENPHILPRPLIVEYQENKEPQLNDSAEEVRLKCDSWRFAVEANNLSPWKMIPIECADYVREYITGKGYKYDLERVSNEARVYARSYELNGDGKDAWVFDVDETLISNLPYYSKHGYGMELFDSAKFDKWVEKGIAPAIPASLNLYREVLNLGFKVFLLTGRNQRYADITAENLVQAGFHDWDKLVMRGSEDHGKLATVFKSEKRDQMVEEGYRIIGNSGDQWSDLLGTSIARRSFKLPNPIYYIA